MSHITKTKTPLTTRELTQIGLFVALIAVLAQISIPQPSGIPFSLQAWAIALSGVVLGAKKGALAATAYALLGLAGLPIFVGMVGGVGVMAGPTGGFIWTFPALALLAGIGASRGVFMGYVGMVLGVLVNFAGGLIDFTWVTSLSWQASLGFAVVPFVIPTVAQIALVPLLGRTIRTALLKAQVGL